MAFATYKNNFTRLFLNNPAKCVPRFGFTIAGTKYFLSRAVLFIFLLLPFSQNARAAFPIPNAAPLEATTAVTPVATHKGEYKQTFIAKIFRKISDIGERHSHRITVKKRGTAIAYGILGAFYWILGVHRLYLGYTWQGLVQMLGPAVGGIILAISLLSFSSATPIFLGAMAALGIIMIIGAYVWHIVDIIRIASGSLQPRWGYYENQVNRKHPKREVKHGYAD